MKLLSKINRGLIATLIVLIAVIIYIIAVNVGQDMQKPEIKKACADYISMDIKYKLLPSDYTDVTKKVPQSLQDSIILNMKSDIKATYIDNKPLVDTVIKEYQDNLDLQFKNGANLKSLKRQILKFSSINFEGNTVVVNFDSLVDEELITSYSTDSITGVVTPTFQANNSHTSERISFEKVDGKWKVVVANLTTPSLNPQGKMDSGGVKIQ
jgi:hypothetical protein